MTVPHIIYRLCCSWSWLGVRMSWSAIGLTTSWTALWTIQRLSPWACCRWAVVHIELDAMSSTASCTKSSFSVSPSPSSPPPRPAAAAAEATAARRRRFAAAQQFHAAVDWILGRQRCWNDRGHGGRLWKSPAEAVRHRARARPAADGRVRHGGFWQTGKTETTSNTLHSGSAQRTGTLVRQDTLSRYLHARGTRTSRWSHWVTCSGMLSRLLMTLNLLDRRNKDNCYAAAILVELYCGLL